MLLDILISLFFFIPPSISAEVRTIFSYTLMYLTCFLLKKPLYEKCERTSDCGQNMICDLSGLKECKCRSGYLVHHIIWFHRYFHQDSTCLTASVTRPEVTGRSALTPSAACSVTAASSVTRRRTGWGHVSARRTRDGMATAASTAQAATRGQLSPQGPSRTQRIRGPEMGPGGQTSEWLSTKCSVL